MEVDERAWRQRKRVEAGEKRMEADKNEWRLLGESGGELRDWRQSLGAEAVLEGRQHKRARGSGVDSTREE